MAEAEFEPGAEVASGPGPTSTLCTLMVSLAWFSAPQGPECVSSGGWYRVGRRAEQVAGL